MICRNSFKSVFRTPVKTGLFLLLVAAITAFACLGIGMRRATQDILDDANKAFETTAVLQYLGAYYPDPDRIDEEMVTELSGFDLTQLTSQPEVLNYDKQLNFGGVIPGLEVSSVGKRAYQDYGVLIFRAEYDTDDTLRCLILDTLYSPEYYEGFFFNLKFSDSIRTALEKTGQLPVKGGTYLAFGRFYEGISRTLLFEVVPYENPAAPDNAEVQALMECPFIDLSDFERSTYAQASGYSIFENIAGACDALNNYLYVSAADDPSSYLCFQQQETHLTSGRFITKEDRGKQYCMVSDYLMRQMELTLGDTIDLGLCTGIGTEPAYKCYWPEAGFLHQEKYQIIGTFMENRGLVYNIYIPRDESFMPNDCIDYTICRFRLDNAGTDAWQKAVKPHLLPDMQLFVFDHGYSEVVSAIETMQEGTGVLLAISGISALVILLLFSYLYVAKQNMAVRIMLSLGAGRKRSMRYLILGALILVLIAVILGAAVGYLASEKVINDAYLDAASGIKYDDRFSNAVIVGEQTNFNAQIESSFLDPLLTAGIILATALVLTGIFALIVTRDRALEKMPSTKQRKKVIPVAAATTAVMAAAEDGTDNESVEIKLFDIEKQTVSPGIFWKMAFPLRMALRSIFRGKGRNVVAGMASLCMVVLIGVFSSSLEAYKAEREAVYDKIPILTYVTNFSGRQIDDIFIPEDTVQLFTGIKDIAQTYLTQTLKYQIRGAVKKADGTEVPDPGELEIPLSGFAAETFADKIRLMDNVIFTNSLRHVPAYFFEEEVPFSFLDGYDETAFTGEEAVCCVSQKFLEENSLALGDVIRLTGLRRGTSEALHGSFEVKIIGICPMLDGGNDIYASMSAKGPVDFLLNLVNYFGRYDVTEEYCQMVMKDDPTLKNQETVSRFHFIPFYDSASFLVKDAKNLSAYKDHLQEARISPVGKVNETRVYAVVRDQVLYETINNLTRHISYMKALNIGVYVLSIAMGFVISYLLTRTRKPELALLRSTGAGQGRTFVTFFLEQGLMCLLGTGLGLLLCYLIYSQLRAAGALFYALCYLAGVVAAVLMMNRRSVLAILGAKE